MFIWEFEALGNVDCIVFEWFLKSYNISKNVSNIRRSRANY